MESDYEVETPDSSDGEGDLQPVGFVGAVHFMDLAGGGGGKGQSKGKTVDDWLRRLAAAGDEEKVDIETPPKTPEQGDNEPFSEGDEGSEMETVEEPPSSSTAVSFTVFGTRGGTDEGGGKGQSKGYMDEYGITFGADGLITQEWPSPAAGPSSSTDGPGETMRSQFLKEVKCLEQTLNFYKDSLSSYNEEELEEERQTYFTRIIEAMQNDTLLDDGAPQFMPPRPKKARITAESKTSLLASLNSTLRMNATMLGGSRDPDVVAAGLYLVQQLDLASANAGQWLTSMLDNCVEADLEKIIGCAGITNNGTKLDTITRAIMKQMYAMLQVKELEHIGVKAACSSLTQYVIANAFANDSGLVSWTGKGMTMQWVSATC